MSKIHIQEIKGNHNVIGDNNFITNNFYEQHSNVEFSEVERQLVNIIFDNTSSDQERKEILNSLIEIKSEKDIIKNQSALKKLETFTKGVGQFAMGVLQKIVADEILNHNGSK